MAPDVLVALLADVGQPLDRDAVLSEEAIGQLERLAVDLGADFLDGSQRRRPHERLTQPVVVRVIVVRAREVIDVGLGDVGAERLLGRLEAGADGAVVCPLDELGIAQHPSLPKCPLISLT